VIVDRLIDATMALGLLLVGALAVIEGVRSAR
jgi:hypothetical protein